MGYRWNNPDAMKWANDLRHNWNPSKEAGRDTLDMTYEEWIDRAWSAAQEKNIEAQHSGGVASKRGTANKQSSKCLCETSETGTKNVHFLYISPKCPRHKKLRS